MSELSQEKLIEEELAKLRENVSAAVGNLLSAHTELDAVKAEEITLAAQQKALAERRKIAERTYSRARTVAKNAGVTSDTLSKFPVIAAKPAKGSKPQAKGPKPTPPVTTAPAPAPAAPADTSGDEHPTAQEAIAS